ncbi:MAG TPA: hypothetical protein VGJ44_07690 [Kribbellaceae bacterium]|jgi:hypothetical protein
MSDDDFGSRLEQALHAHASDAPRAGDLAGIARRRVRRRRQAVVGTVAVACAVVVGGGLVNAIGRTGAETSAGSAANGADSREGPGPAYAGKGTERPQPASGGAPCPADHPLLRTGDYRAPGNGVTLDAVVTGAWVCRYRTAPSRAVLSASPPATTPLLGAVHLDANRATEVLAAIRALPADNPALPAPTCTSAADYPREAIVVRFTTKAGLRELWVEYDGCVGPGFYTADGRKGLYAAPLRLLATGPARPSQGTWLTLIGW